MMGVIGEFAFSCLNLDLQDFRIKRVMSESGWPGFQDFRMNRIIV